MKLTKSLFGGLKAVIPIFLVLNLNAQIKESFDDGNLNNNPTWKGDTVKLKVISGKLQSQSSVVSDKFYLSTPSKTIENTQWEFFINLQFNTSSVNYVEVFLTSDSANLLSNNSGYLIRIGTSADNISLLKKVGNLYTTLINGKQGTSNHSSSVFKIKATCDVNRKFTLWYDSSGLGNNFTPEGSVIDTNITQANYFGIAIRQSTAGFHNRHFFDDFYIGKIITDTIKPFVKGIEIKSPDTLRVFFSEKLSSGSLNHLNFDVDNTIGNPFGSRFISADSSVVELAMVNSLAANTVYHISITNCTDMAANRMVDTIFKLRWYQYENPLPYDIVINELMPDPEPAVGLPKEEYIELYNRSNKFLQLQNCFLGDGSSGGKLPYFVLEPDSFVLVCETGNESLFALFGKTLGLKGFPSLNNSGDDLFLSNSLGQIIHHLKYDLSSYDDLSKTDGGWSLEMIDPENMCNALNFKASVATIGGSPCRINSVRKPNPDFEKPFIKKVAVTSDSIILLTFNEAIDSIRASDTLNYKVTENAIKSVSINLETLEFKLVKPLTPNKYYTFTLAGLRDRCNNNSDTALIILVPEKPKRGDIIINEILFNPVSGGSDFIEIYNSTDKILTLKNLSLYNLDEDKQPDNIRVIDTSGAVLLPKRFMVFTSNPSWVSRHYKNCDSTTFFRLASLPAMADDYGHIGLADENKTTIDELDYNKSMHLQLLTDFEGVSLERISYSVPSSEISNWTSCASTYGFATPGFENSHLFSVKNSDDWLKIEPLLFSPDDDGNSDLVSFTIKSTAQSQQVSLIIFDSYGRLVNTIVNNASVGNSQTWFWDGVDKDNKKAAIGIYIVYAELFGTDGKKYVKKKTVTLGGK